MDERDKQLAVIDAYCEGRSCKGCPLYPFDCGHMSEWSSYEVYKAYQLLFGLNNDYSASKLAELSAKLDVITEKIIELSAKVDAIS